MSGLLGLYKRMDEAERTFVTATQQLAERLDQAEKRIFTLTRENADLARNQRAIADRYEKLTSELASDVAQLASMVSELSRLGRQDLERIEALEKEASSFSAGFARLEAQLGGRGK